MEEQCSIYKTAPTAIAKHFLQLMTVPEDDKHTAKASCWDAGIVVVIGKGKVHSEEGAALGYEQRQEKMAQKDRVKQGKDHPEEENLLY